MICNDENGQKRQNYSRYKDEGIERPEWCHWKEHEKYLPLECSFVSVTVYKDEKVKNNSDTVS